VAAPNVGTALVGAWSGYLLGHWLGNVIASGYQQHRPGQRQNDVADRPRLGPSAWSAGWRARARSTTRWPRWWASEPARPRCHESTELDPYFRYTADHKVVGLQYLVGVLLFFFTGGLLAMAIRTELLSPTNHVFGPGTYIEVVGEHGTIMMMMASSVVVGPLGNYLVPLMIGSPAHGLPPGRGVLFWVFMAGYGVIVSALPLGGFPTGWTGYAPLQTQAGVGMDSYLVGFAVIGIGHDPGRVQPGRSRSSLPGAGHDLEPHSHLRLGHPGHGGPADVGHADLVAAGLFGVLDRTAQTAFFVNEHGGSVPVAEPVLVLRPSRGLHHGAARDSASWHGDHAGVHAETALRLQGAAAGMIGVALLSFFVWQHHLFQSGIDPDMRPLFMLTTELISIPTGFIFLVGMGTLWKSKIRFELPMLFCLAVFFNFLIGGVTGSSCPTCPVDVTVHGASSCWRTSTTPSWAA
jgi:cytochrome c oxidase subunit I